ncbi:MAG TPA: hypothetical protein VEK08_14660 [Planctomycetota bacterium]|nr:hypothetical protein [Planctomycetota bacterium]
MGAAAETVRPLNAAAAAPAKAAANSPSPAANGSSGLRILKFFVALALIPACIGLSIGVHEAFLGAWTRMNLAAFGPGALLKWFLSGIGAFAVLAILLWRPVVVYVFGHELIHALATWMCLGKVSNLSASARGGQVTTSKSNTFIRLAPYCVPLYAILAAALYFALNAWWRPLGAHIQWLAFALGFFYAFHIGFTLWSLRRDQPDLRPDGWLFSLVVIYLANLAVFVLLMGFIMSGQPSAAWDSVKDSSQLGVKHSRQIYRNLGNFAQNLVSR